ncbi:MAG: hypothetical protein KDK24_17745 [Pseudooceanicola sp.]|nr:hypothetical protein [Pseudooceanicola sp.]
MTYLLLERGEFHGREKLSGLLWETFDRQKARTSLRQVIAILNRELSGRGVLIQSKDTIGLDASFFQLGIEDVLKKMERGRADKDEIYQLSGLRDALSEFEDIGEGFRDWSRNVRGQLIRRTLGRLYFIFRDDEQSSEIRIQAAEIAGLIDEFDEEAIRARMTLHARLNNSVASLRIYDEFFARLEAAMDAEPSLETQDLAVRIKLSQESPTIRPAAAVSTPAETAVAVLPFRNLGPDVLPDYVLLGLLDQITCELTTLRAPAAISSNTTRRYLGAVTEPSTVGRELNVSYVVDGNIRSQGGEASISVQVARTSDNHLIWARTFTCPVDDIFRIRTPLAQEIVRAVSPSINAAELLRTSAAPETRLEPFHLVLRAKDMMFHLARAPFNEAGELLRRAVAKGPYFAPAHALISEWYMISVWQGWSTDVAADRRAINTHLGRAIALAPDDGRALALWGHSRMIFEREYDRALENLDTARELCPNDSETLVWSVPTLAYTGEAERAIQLGERAIRLSPLDPFAFRNEHFLSLAYYSAGEFDRAAQLGLSSFERAPSYGSNIRVTIAALEASNRMDEAQPLLSRHQRIEPDFSLNDYFSWQGFRSDTVRRQFCDRLHSAGLPA